ncbi:MAG: zf-TFIIB domain-containing protein [bacterium]
MRTCPDCSISLDPIQASYVELDQCPNCGGVWFDAKEFDAILGNRLAGHDVEEALDGAAFVRLDARPCPDGHGTMQGVAFGPAELDRCRSCRGIWVSGEARKTLATLPRVEAAASLQPAVEHVECSHCHAVVHRKQAVLHDDAYWCDACVLAGNYPGANAFKATQMLATARHISDHRQLAAKDLQDSYRSIHSPLESILWRICQIMDFFPNRNWWF